MFNSVSTPLSPPSTTTTIAATTTTTSVRMGETSRIRSFMGRSTPAIGVLKTKFLTVLGNSNELLNGISSRFTLNISSSDSDYCDDDDDEEEGLPKFDDFIDYTKIDYESRRVKARRAHEEIISGRYRQPNLAPRPRLDTLYSKRHGKVRSSSTASSSSSTSTSTSTSSRSFLHNANEKTHISHTTMSDSLESRHSGGYTKARAIPGARRSELDIQRDVTRLNEIVNVANTPHIEVQSPHQSKDVKLKKPQNQQKQHSQQQQQQTQPLSHIIPDDNVENGNGGEISGSDADKGGSGDRNGSCAVSGALTAVSNHSKRVPTNSRRKDSICSTLTSLRDDPDIQISPSIESTDWRHFVRSESQNSVPSWASSISLDCRSSEESIKEFMKRFTQNLFCNINAIDAELKAEFSSMIHTEIGRQWFCRFLLEQRNKYTRIDELTFHSLVQYFSIILFECKECEDYTSATTIMNLCFLFYREVEVPGCEPYREYLFTYIREQPIWLCVRFWTIAFCDTLQNERDRRLAARQKKIERHQAKDDNKLQDKSSTNSVSHPIKQNKAKEVKNSHKLEMMPYDIDTDMENITFHLLGAFTCNIHALGVPQEVCLEFFKKSINGLKLSKEKIKLIRENIHRMYYETDLWGAKQS